MNWRNVGGRKDEQHNDRHMFDEIKVVRKATDGEKECVRGRNAGSKRRNVAALSQVCGLNTYLKVMDANAKNACALLFVSHICCSVSPTACFISAVLNWGNCIFQPALSNSFKPAVTEGY